MTSGHRRTLFSIPFTSGMSDADFARLRSTLDLVIYSSPKPGVSGASLGVVPLDPWSGLFLERGAGENEWILEARTWGRPGESSVHEWQVRAASAARQLDRSVEVPPRERSEAANSPLLEVGRAASSRRGRLGRRLLGLE
jgi:hypothetical protein